MSDVELAELERMTMAELRLLKGQIDEAIRAAIAKTRASTAPAVAQPKPEPMILIDLERERDAWQARRKLGGQS